MPVPVKVLFADDADLLMNKGKVDAAKAVAFQLDHTKPISDVLESLAELLQLPAAADHFALVLQENGQYVEEAADLEAVKADSVVLVKVQPRERVQQVLDQLALGPDASGLKNVIFRMRYQVVDPGFAEEFISRGGMEQLLSIVLDTTGNIQAYALTAVRCFMGYHNGLQEFLESPELIDKLFYLVDSKVVATVTRQAVELLFVLCNFDGWGLVHKAAKFTARIRGEQPYANVLKLLDSGDLDTKLNALTLLNSLLDNAPDKTKVQKMVLDWRNMDLSNVIYRLRKVEDPQLKTQLEIFESVAGEFLDVPSLSQADQLAQYEAQQPLLQLLVSELQHCYKLIQVAQESGALLSARAPSKRFEPSKGWARADRPVDLSFMQRGAATSNPDAINQKLTRLSEYFTQRQAGGGATRQGGGFGTRAMVKKPEQPAAPPASVEEATHAVNAPAETKSEVPDTPEVAAADSPDATLDSPDATLEASDAAPPPADDDTASSAPAAAVPAAGEAAAPGMEGEVPAEGSGAPPAPPMPNGGGGAPPPPPMPGSGGAPPPPPMPGSGPPGPPPPPGSGPPPPPGMGGLGMGGVQPTKPVVKPTVKMKPLFWKRIILPASGEKKTSSIWSQVDELDINIREFEDAFRAKPTKKPKAKAEGESNEKFKRILDPKRSNAVAILCSGLPDPSRLVKAIEDLDSRVLKRDMIVQLINNAPTAEEIAAIKEAKAAGGAGLDMPEQFCLELSSVSKLKERLECWEFRMGFKEKYNDIEPPLFLAKTACKELKSSGKLRQTFGIILAVGNYMNGGSKRGQADGFQVDVLPKLMDTKDAEGNSLMEFVVQHMRKKHEALLKLPGELAHVPECRGLSLKQLQGDLRQLQGKVNLFKTKSKACLDAGVGGAFARVVNEFEKELEEKMTKVEKEYAEAEQKYNDILKFFSITTSMESDEFFGIFGSFVANFKFVIKKIEQDEAAKKKGSERKKVNAGKKIAGAAAGEADPMANIIAAIRAGKSSSLKDANKAASEEGEGEAPAPANPMSFGLRKVQRPEKPKEEPKKEEGFSFQLRKVQRDEKPAAKQEEAPAFTAPALRKVVREDKPKEPEKSGSLGFEVKLKPASERVIDAADDE